MTTMKRTRASKAAATRRLAALARAARRCRACDLWRDATQTVFGEGPADARFFIIGEQAGDQEDRSGHPFVGPAGGLLDKALAEAGIARGQTYVTNVIKHFKFELRGKRRIHKSPSQREAAACLHWLEDEIALVRPLALVALGSIAARSIMNRAVPVMAERGHWLTRPDGRQVLITLHPSALLRVREGREEAFDSFVQDLSKARKLFKSW
jgi:uracil-DNA glycosylase family protein